MTICNTYHLDDPRRACILPAAHTGPHKSTNETWYDPADDMDVSVTAALVEKETEQDEGAHIEPEGETDWHGLYLAENRRAERAEKDRDRWQANALAHDEDWTMVRRALNIPSDATADDIVHHIRVNRTRAVTDEMVQRGKLAFYQTAEGDLSLDVRVRRALTAALTEPTRPEGAVTLASDLDEAHKGGGDVQDEADRLYAMGYRKSEDGGER